MLTTVDSEKITVSVTAVGLTAVKLTSDISSVSVHAEGDIRYWTSRKNPTSTDGIPLYDGTERVFSLSDASGFKAIRKGASDAAIHVQYHVTR